MRTMHFPTRNTSMNSLFDDLFNDFPTKLHLNESWSPKANIQENSDEWNIELMVPGMRKEDFALEVADNKLIVKAELEKEKTEEDKSYKYREFSTASFKRTFNLPKGLVDEAKISAKYESGILFVNLPKLEEAKDRGPRVIEIQ
ncbi:MAG: Hsp20/alpha crystallin family protein [Flavobacteriia bacterium]|nr:Hsp20/alpha crystallin family protein [Flavobacteriia bacterium]